MPPPQWLYPKSDGCACTATDTQTHRKKLTILFIAIIMLKWKGTLEDAAFFLRRHVTHFCHSERSEESITNEE